MRIGDITPSYSLFVVIALTPCKTSDMGEVSTQ